MKKLSILMAALAVLLSNVMCAFVGYSYASLTCAAEHGGSSAPASIAFLYAIPFLPAITVTVICCLFFAKKSREP